MLELLAPMGQRKRDENKEAVALLQANGVGGGLLQGASPQPLLASFLFLGHNRG